MARDGLTEPIRHRRERTPLPAWAQEMPAKKLRGFPTFGRGINNAAGALPVLPPARQCKCCSIFLWGFWLPHRAKSTPP